MNLSEYLTQLNSANSSWGIWVNPENPIEEFRIGQFQFENGGVLDDWICIGNLENLSFGFQSHSDAVTELVKAGSIQYKGRTVRFSPPGLLEAYQNNTLNHEFHTFLELQADLITDEWSEVEADGFVARNAVILRAV